MNVISWLNRILAGKQADNADQIYQKLHNRGSMEIAARLICRAKLHENSHPYLQRCTALDRVAAEQIERLVQLANPHKDITPWRRMRDAHVAQLMENHSP